MPRVMSPLPRSADPRKLCTAGDSFTGQQPVSRLSRLAESVEDDAPVIEYRLSFSRDERHRCILRTQLQGQVSLICQRCMQAVTCSLESDTISQLVWTDEQASQADHEVIMVQDDVLDLLAVLEDEALLSLPLIPKHADCSLPDYKQAVVAADDVAVETKPNPFAVLAALKQNAPDKDGSDTGSDKDS